MAKWTKFGLIALLIISLGLGVACSFLSQKNEANREKIDSLNQEVLALEDKIAATEEELTTLKNNVNNVLEDSLRRNESDIKDINVVFGNYSNFSDIDIEISQSSSLSAEEVYAFALLSKERIGEAWNVKTISDKNGSKYTVDLPEKKLTTSSTYYYFDEDGKLIKQVYRGSSSYSSSSKKSSSSSSSKTYRNGYEMPNENDKSFSDYVKRVAPDLYDSMKENYPD